MRDEFKSIYSKPWTLERDGKKITLQTDEVVIMERDTEGLEEDELDLICIVFQLAKMKPSYVILDEILSNVNIYEEVTGKPDPSENKIIPLH